MALIELRKISKAYGSVQALRELDLTVPEGCLYGLLGPNGAGKTTAMRILATLLSPDSGSVVVGGVDEVDSEPESTLPLLLLLCQDSQCHLLPDLWLFQLCLLGCCRLPLERSD